MTSRAAPVGRTKDKMRILPATMALTLLAALAVPSLAHAEDPAVQRLFHIERNKNANIVAYDARVETDGLLRKKDPVEVYWLKLAEDGARKKLKRIERRMAYGFKVRDQQGDRLRLEMKADIGRDIFVEAVGRCLGLAGGGLSRATATVKSSGGVSSYWSSAAYPASSSGGPSVK